MMMCVFVMFDVMHLFLRSAFTINWTTKNSCLLTFFLFFSFSAVYLFFIRTTKPTSNITCSATHEPLLFLYSCPPPVNLPSFLLYVFHLLLFCHHLTWLDVTGKSGFFNTRENGGGGGGLVWSGVVGVIVVVKNFFPCSDLFLLSLPSLMSCAYSLSASFTQVTHSLFFV